MSTISNHTCDLLNYWPIEGNTNDIIGGLHMTAGSANVYLTDDRFANRFSATNLNNSYYKVPSGVYFNGEFTVSLWIKVGSFSSNARVLDFTNGEQNDLVQLTFCNGNSLTPAIRITDLNTGYTTVSGQSQTSFKTNEWTHLSFSYYQSNSFIYINGKQTLKFKSSAPTQNVRKNNYIGRSLYFPSDPDTNATFDDIKIFSRSLNEFEIQQDLNIKVRKVF